MVQAKKRVKTVNARTSKTTKRKTVKKVTKTSRRPKWLAPLVVVAVGLLGTYLLVNGFAASNNGANADRPDRGFSYGNEKVASSGPCTGHVDEGSDNAGHPLCAHADPGPEGVDVRERMKTIYTQLDKQAKFDAAHPPAASDAPPTDEQAYQQLAGGADVGSKNSLGAVSPRNWPCVGTGSDGARVRMLSLYPSNGTNHMNSTFKSQLDTIARRMNNVFYNSSAGDGGSSRQIRFMTAAPSSGTCGLYVSTLSVPVPTYNIASFSSIKSFLRSKGLTNNNYKYVAWVDYGSSSVCGWGEHYFDSTKGSTNANSTNATYAAIWNTCWNYGEPHELMHALGSVMNSCTSISCSSRVTGVVNAPHSSAGGHCWDQHDVMCYDDDFNANTYKLVAYCSTSYIWHFDCRHDDYFSSGAISSTNYLYSHWNVATTRFLYPNAQ
jgi:hypothetical protein